MNSDRLNMIFANLEADEHGCTKAEFKNLMFDSSRREIEGTSAKEADEQIRKVMFDVLGLEWGKKPTKRDIERAMDRYHRDFFDVIEEVVDEKVSVGIEENPILERFVEKRNIADGDSQEFWNKTDVELVAVKTAGDHMDTTVQRLGEGESVTVGTMKYQVTVGGDLDLFLLGRKSFADLTDAAAAAIVRQVLTDVYAQIMSLGENIPVADKLHKTLPIVSANKDKFDEIIEKVGGVNESGVIILGTKTALKKLKAFADVNWASEAQKKYVNDTGMLGDYEGTEMIEIPQRYSDKTLATELVNSNKILIMPNVDNKFIKLVDQGETQVKELNEKTDRMDETAYYQIERGFGVSTLFTRYFGVWDVTE